MLLSDWVFVNACSSASFSLSLIVLSVVFSSIHVLAFSISLSTSATHTNHVRIPYEEFHKFLKNLHKSISIL